VTKVAPLQNEEEEAPSASPVAFAFGQNLEGKSSYVFARLQDRNTALERQPPPLRGCGRHSAVPRAMYFDIPLEHGETSIIKSHPPRRLQKLEPIDLPQVITSEMLLSQQEARTTHKAKVKPFSSVSVFRRNHFYEVFLTYLPSPPQKGTLGKAGTGKEDANFRVYSREKTIFT